MTEFITIPLPYHNKFDESCRKKKKKKYFERNKIEIEIKLLELAEEQNCSRKREKEWYFRYENGYRTFVSLITKKHLS